MDLKKFKSELLSAVAANKTIAIFCRCIVSYSGRAESELEEGDRLIIVKSDNTILIHQPEGSSPINYMKADSSIDVIDMDGSLLLKSENRKLKESITVFLSEVFEITSHKLEDGRKITLVGNERDMSDMIKNNPSIISKDFIPLSREEHTKFGFIDVFGHDGQGNLVIVECKRYTAGVSAVQQLRRYVEKIVELRGVGKDKVKGVLAAPDIAKNAQEMLIKWGFTFAKAEPPKRHEKYKKDQKQLIEF